MGEIVVKKAMLDLMRARNLLLFACLFFPFFSKAQDAQFSQYYNAPLFLNPAFAGSAQNSRAVFNYRLQWPNLVKPYTTVAASLDHHFEPVNTAVGLIVSRDIQGAGNNLKSTKIGLIGAYVVPVSYEWTFIPALQFSYVNRSGNLNELTFGDQINPSGPTGSPSVDPLATAVVNNYFDLTTGGLIFNKNLWLGLSVSHLNTPDQGFGTEESLLPVKTAFNAGYKIQLESQVPGTPYIDKSITPTLLYKMQGEFDQLDIGLYGIYGQLMLGMWYRGLPIKKYEPNINNHDALIFLAGVNFQGLTIAYSYDLTISSLTPGSGGAHEISIVYEWYKPYKTKKRARPIPCPKFYQGRLRK